MPTINIDLNWPDHPKTKRLIRAAGQTAPFHLVTLWCFAAKYHPDDGDLSSHTPQDIEGVSGWTGEAGVFYTALLASGFLDGCLTLHDWEEHEGHLAVYREKCLKMNKIRWDKVRSSIPQEPNKESNKESSKESNKDSSRTPSSVPFSSVPFSSNNIAQAQVLKTEPEQPPPQPEEETEAAKAKKYRSDINKVVTTWMINKMPVYRDVIGGIPYKVHDVWLPYRPSPTEMKSLLDTFYYNCANPRVVLANMKAKGDVKGEQISKVRREYSDRTELPFSL